MLLVFGVVGVVAVAAAVAALTEDASTGPVIVAVIGGFVGVVTVFGPTVLDRFQERKQARAAADNTAELVPQGPATLLHPVRGVVPFQGRERELAELLEWCADPDAGRVRLLTGPGGVGKSRLAKELADRLRPKWRVLEVRDDAEGEALSRLREVEPRRPC